MSTGKIIHGHEHTLKMQLADSLKILGIGVTFFLIPGASMLMPLLIIVEKKHNINLLPLDVM